MSMKSSNFGPIKFGKSLTKQSFKDQCDINKIVKRAQVKGGLAHVQKYPEATYGEFDPGLDLFVARERINRATQIFEELPAEVRREFGNDPIEFVTYANSLPVDQLIEKIPAIAEPGNYFPNPVKAGGQGAGAATAPSEPAQAPEPTPDPAPAPSPDPGS